MNRMEEYRDLMCDLKKPVDGVEGTLKRAERKRKRRKRILHPLMSAAAVGILFVLMVNISSSVAYACSKIPVLRELARAVTFSRSLIDAVDNEYVQMMNLVQQENDVTAKIEYLIVDQRQVNVFFRLNSEVYEKLEAEMDILQADGSHIGGCSYGINNWNVENGELQSLTIDFVDQNVPENLWLKLKIRDLGAAEEGTSIDVKETMTEVAADENYIAEFDFLLEFDPLFTAAVKQYDIQETMVLDGQKITITDVAVYPTHMQVNVMDMPENISWLRSLEFYVVTEDGTVFEPLDTGLIANGSKNTDSMVSFRADSSYFYEAKELKLIITGAEWLRKDSEKLYINLETGETGEMPEGVEFYSAEKTAEGWEMTFRAVEKKENHYYQILLSKFYDAAGNEYDIQSWGTYDEYPNEEETVTHFFEKVSLADYSGTEVWVTPNFSYKWIAKVPVEIKVK